MAEPCGNCGKALGVISCGAVWRKPHTHPASASDLSPVPCSLVLCRRCATMVERNLRSQLGRSS